MAASPASAKPGIRKEPVSSGRGKRLPWTSTEKNTVLYPVMREKERTGVIRGMILPEIVPEMMFLEDCPAMRETGSTLLCPVLPLHARRSACLLLCPGRSAAVRGCRCSPPRLPQRGAPSPEPEGVSMTKRVLLSLAVCCFSFSPRSGPSPPVSLRAPCVTPGLTGSLTAAPARRHSLAHRGCDSPRDLPGLRSRRFCLRQPVSLFRRTGSVLCARLSRPMPYRPGACRRHPVLQCGIFACVRAGAALSLPCFPRRHGYAGFR